MRGAPWAGASCPKLPPPPPALTARRNAFSLGRSGIADIQGKEPPPAPCAACPFRYRNSGCFLERSVCCYSPSQVKLLLAPAAASCTAASLLAAQELRRGAGAYCAAQQRRQVTIRIPPRRVASHLLSCLSLRRPLIFVYVFAG